MKIIIVDEHDNEIGLKDRADMTPQDIYRVSALWVTNARGDILLAQRKFTKKHDPGKWGPAVAGTVDEGETYELNMLKETQEEIGITLKENDYAVGPKYRSSETQYDYYVQWYTAVISEPLSFFTIQEDEVEQVCWYPREELRSILATQPDDFLPSVAWCIDNL